MVPQRGFGEQLKCQNNHHSPVAPDRRGFVSFLFVPCPCPLPATASSPLSKPLFLVCCFGLFFYYFC